MSNRPEQNRRRCRIARQALPPSPAEEFVHRTVERLFFEIPEGNVGGSKGLREDTVVSELNKVLGKRFDHDNVLEEVLPDDLRRHVPGEDRQRFLSARHGRCLAYAIEAVFTDDPNEGTRSLLLLTQNGLEALNGSNAH